MTLIYQELSALDISSTIQDIDTRLFILLNEQHNSFFDMLMYWFSHKFFWIPLYLFLVYLVYKQVEKRVWLVVLAAGLVILFSDQISVHAFKNVFQRLRPCHNALIESQVHLLNGHCGGSFGFVSSHAANVFALAMFLFLFFRGRYKNFGKLIFLWAGVVSYSRIYAGVHYPGDVIVGALLGMGIGISVFKAYELAEPKIFKL